MGILGQKRLLEEKGLAGEAPSMCLPFEGTHRAHPALYPWQPSQD